MKYMQPSRHIVEAPEKGGERSEPLAKIASIFEGLEYQKEHSEQPSDAQVALHASRILDAGGTLRERSRQAARKQNERVDCPQGPVDVRAVGSPSAMVDP